MQHWSDKYIGIAYVKDKYDCGSLVEQVLREQYGVNVQMPSTRAASHLGRVDQLNTQLANLKKVDVAKEGDVIYMRKGALRHVGIALWINNEAWVLHCCASVNVIRTRVRDMPMLGYIIESAHRCS